MEFVERFPTDRLPSSGGVNATIVITMDLSTLLDGIGVASLDTGESITASQARRLACEAGIIPAVLSGTSHAHTSTAPDTTPTPTTPPTSQPTYPAGKSPSRGGREGSRCRMSVDLTPAGIECWERGHQEVGDPTGE